MTNCLDCQKEIILSKEEQKLERIIGISPIRCEKCTYSLIQDDLKKFIIQIRNK